MSINTTGNAADTSAMLDITSASKGLLMPRMTQAQRIAIFQPADGLIVYQTDGVKGFYYYLTNAWVLLAASGSAITSLNGLTASVQTFATPGTSGTAPNWSSSSSAHTLHIPMSSTSGVTAGLLSYTDYTAFNNKLGSLNGLTGATQTFATGTSGTNFNISSSGSTHTFNIPDASASNRGVVTTGAQTLAGNKTFSGNITASSLAGGATTDSIVTADATTGLLKRRTVANVLSGATTNTLSSSVNTITSTVNGVAATAPAVNSVSNTSSVNNLTTTINGVAGTSVPMVNSVANTSSANNLTTTINGVAATAVPMVNSVANTSSVNSLTTTINGVAGSSVNLVNSNATSLSGSSLTTTVNGVASTALDLSPIVAANGWSKTGNSGTTAGTNFIGTTDAVDFVTKTNGNERVRVSSTGNVGINNASPGSTLDVKGTMRLSGSLSGYVGFQPAAAAGSTTYTLPSADGSADQVLATNGSGVLSWANLSQRSFSASVTAGNMQPLARYNHSEGSVALSIQMQSTTSGNSGTKKYLFQGGYAAIGALNTWYKMQPVSNGRGHGDFPSGFDLYIKATDFYSYEFAVSAVTNNKTLRTTFMDLTNGNMNFTDVSGNAALAISTGGDVYSIRDMNVQNNVGIGTATPGSALDVRGTMRLSGSTSGYVGLAPAAAAGSTTYTLPSADGTSGQQLTTNGSGTLSWSNQTGTTTNTLSSSVNTITSTVNGVAATAPAVNSVSNTSSVNNLTTTINGIAGTAVPMVNSIANTSSANNLTTTVNGVAATAVPMVNSVANTSSVNNLTTTINGVAATAVPMVNSVANTSSVNNLTTTINGVAGTSVPMVNTNAIALSGTSLTSTVNGVASNALNLTSAIAAATTNTVGSAGTNIITSTVNGVTDTALVVNSVANTSSANNLTTTINGVAATAVPMVNSIANTSSANNLTTTVNGVAATAVPMVNSVANTSSVNNLSTTINGVAGTAVPMVNSNTTSLSGTNLTTTVNGVASTALNLTPAVTAATTNTLSSSTNTITSTVNGVAATAPAVNSVSNTSSVNNLSTTINGVAGTAVPMVNSVANTSSVNNLTTTINGVAGTAVPIVNSVSNTSSTNSLTTSVNGVAGSSVNIINTNATSLSGTNLTTTVNGVAATALDLSPAISATAWKLAGNTTTTGVGQFLGSTDNRSLRFRTNNIEKMILDSLGNAGIGSSSFNATNPERLLADAGATGNTNYQNVIVGKGNTNSYAQLNIQNTNAGTGASSDVVATADNGSETTNYIDMGINSSVNSSAVMGAANDAYLYNLGQNLLIGTGTAGKVLAFLTGGTTQGTNERMRIDGSGNVGIGTTAPGSSLDVKGTLRLSGITSGYVGFAPAAAAGSTTYTLPSADGTSGQQLTTNGSGVLTWSNQTGATTVSNTSSANNLSTTVNGVTGSNVSIINTNALSLGGTFLTSTINGQASNALDLSSLLSNTGWSRTGNAATTAGTNFIGTTDAVDFVVKTSSVERMRFLQSGNVGIGSSAPTTKLQVEGANPLTLLGVATGTNTNSDSLLTITSGLIRKLPLNNFTTNFNSWNVTGNSATTPGTNFIGTTDAQAFIIKENATQVGRFDANSIALGNGATTNTATNSYTLGSSASISSGRTGAYAIGSSAAVTADSSFSIGNTASSTAISALTLGNAAVSNSRNSITIGSAATTSFAITNPITIGANSTVTGSKGVALGDSARAVTGANSTAIGANASTLGPNASAFGAYATVSGFATNATAIGYGATASGTGSTAVGANAVVTQNNAMLLGDATNASLNVGIGTSTPGSKLDVKGTLRLSGSTSGYVGFVPAAAAGSTTYTLPAADGTANQALTTNGSGVLSWVAPSATNWGISGNSGTTAGTNFLGTTDARDFVFKTNNTERIRVTSGGLVGYNSITPTYRLQVEDPGGPDGDIAARVYNTGNLAYYASFQLQASAGTRAAPTAVTSGTKLGGMHFAGYDGATWNDTRGVSIQGITSENWSTTAHGSYMSLNTIANGATAQSERIRIENNGSVGVGTSTFNATYPEKFIVDGGASGNTNYQNVIVGKGNTNSYAQLNIQNSNAGTTASSDVVATADNGNETTNYIDMGINSSGNTAAFFGGANDAYLYTASQNLLIGTAAASKTIAFLTGGGTQSTNERMRVDGATGYVAVGTTTPTSTLSVFGSMTVRYRTTSGAITLGATDYVAINTGAAATWTLPAASTCTGRIYKLTNHGTGAITLSLSVIDGNGSTTTNLSNNVGSNAMEIISDGTNWRKLN